MRKCHMWWGRYDYLAEELGGKPTPSRLCRRYERVLMTIIKQNIEIPLWGGIKVFVAVTGQDGVNTALKLPTS